MIVAGALAGAAVLVGVGVWGRRRAADLVPVHLDPEGRILRIRALRRGSVACFVVAGLLVVAAVLRVLQ